MMMLSLVLLISLASLDVVSGIKCYDCDTFKHGHENCGYHSKMHPQQSKYVTHCRGTCKISVYEKSGKVIMHLRACDNQHHQGGCTGWETFENGSLISCHCRRDFCNNHWDMIHTSVMERLMTVKTAALHGNGSKSLSALEPKFYFMILLSYTVAFVIKLRH